MLSNSEQYNQKPTLSNVDEYLIERISYEAPFHKERASFFPATNKQRLAANEKYGMNFDKETSFAEISLSIKNIGLNRTRYKAVHKNFSYIIPKIISRALGPCVCSKSNCLFKEGIKDYSVFFFNYEFGVVKRGYNGQFYFHESSRLEGFFYLAIISSLLFAFFYGILSVF